MDERVGSRMEIETTIGEYMAACTWYAHLPTDVRHMVDRYPPGSKWHIDVPGIVFGSQFWYIPAQWGDTVLAMEEIRVLDGKPTGQVFEVRPDQLLPLITH